MADTLPVDTTSPAIAALTCPPDEHYVPSLDELVRQAAAAKRLAKHAAKRKVAPSDYEKTGLDLEWHHQVDDPAVPYSPYLNAGGQS